MQSYSEPIVVVPYGEQPAFPCGTPVEKYTSGETKRCASGLTVRDWFAAQALAGMLARADFVLFPHADFVFFPHDDMNEGLAARNAYRIADAMLKAREGK